VTRASKLRIPLDEMMTTVHAIAVLALVEMSIRWVPLPRLTRLLGLRLNFAPARRDVEQLDESELPAVAQRQLRCARRVADVWPFSKGPCLRRSLVAGHLLRRHDPAVRLGTIGAGESLTAHAWIEIDDRPLESISDVHAFLDPPTGARR
jgi:hypothetical protein